MSKELKPCPFCGCEAMKLFGYDIHKVGCSNVNCDIYGVAKYPKDWNKRSTDRLEQENAELREGLQDLLDCKGILTSDKECVIKAKQLLNK